MSQRQAFRITDLSGGLNPDSNPVLIGDNEATAVRNIRFDQMGSLVSRRGYSRYLDEDAGSDLLAIGRWLAEGAVSGGQIIAHTDAGELVEVTAGHTVLFTGLSLTAGGRFMGVEDRAVYSNGVDRPVAYDGSTAYALGVSAPVSAPTVALNGAGSITGVVSYAYTFYDNTTGTESNPSPVSADISPSSQSVLLTGLPGGHPRANRVRIYRTDPGGTALFFLDDIAVTETTYDDDGATSGNALLPLVYDNDVPLAFENMAYVKGYAFGSIGDTLYWSKAYDIEHWPALNFTPVPFEGNDTIRALASFQDTLIVFGRRNIVLVAGAGGQWSLSRTDVDSGVVSPKAIVELDGVLVYLDYDGLKTIPGSERVAPKLDRVFAAMSPSTLEEYALLYVPEERALWASSPSGTYTVHLPNRAISWYDFGANQWVPGGLNGFGYPLFTDPASSRYVNTYGAVNDLGANIPILWRSKIFQLTNPELTKFFRRIGAFASTGAAGTVTINIADAARSVSVALASTSNDPGGVWDSAVWGTDVWAAEGLVYFIGALPAQALFGHTMQVTITADVGTTTEVVPPITFEFREANRFLGL